MNARILFALLGALTLATPAAAETRHGGGGGGDWTILGADTLPPGTNVVDGRFGWPEMTFELKHGVDHNFDIGGQVSFIYGTENRSDFESQFGMGFAVPLRWTLSRSGTVHVGFHLDPGLKFYTYDNTLFGFQMPLGLNIEIPVNPKFKFGFGADFHATLFVVGDFTPSFFFGPLVGPYFEFHPDPRFTVGVDSRFGDVIYSYSHPSGSSGHFGWLLQMMLGYRL